MADLLNRERYANPILLLAARGATLLAVFEKAAWHRA